MIPCFCLGVFSGFQAFIFAVSSTWMFLPQFFWFHLILEDSAPWYTSWPSKLWESCAAFHSAVKCQFLFHSSFRLVSPLQIGTIVHILLSPVNSTDLGILNAWQSNGRSSLVMVEDTWLILLLPLGKLEDVIKSFLSTYLKYLNKPILLITIL